MRTLCEMMQADLDSGVTTHCRCWRVTRADGEVHGFTDHDRDLSFEGLTYSGASGFGLSELEQATGLQAGQGELVGAMRSDHLSEAQLLAGLWDAAKVELWRVDWRDPERRVHLASGRLGEVTLQDGRFQAQWLGPAARLDTVIGRQFTRRCDARLGDARCQVASDHPDYERGCDQSFHICQHRFGNTVNFRGFPYLPGNDVLIAGASGDQIRDGASRGRS
ncbi:MAG: DUF2163 domain-containing protein [Alphaproteobacteria bacterium]|nr:DUF2163 domain-containing protein [Alphaproteobacteria bacterium]